jgi:hypothetical protein
MRQQQLNDVKDLNQTESRVLVVSRRTDRNIASTVKYSMLTNEPAIGLFSYAFYRNKLDVKLWTNQRKTRGFYY